jgi:AraC family transcriptional regulator
MAALATERVPIDLSQPPEVVMIGVGRHGIARLRDTYSLADLWALHVYEYDGTLAVRDLDTSRGSAVEPVEIALHPGVVTLVPPGAITEYRYDGPSEHLFAHLRLPRPALGASQSVPLWQQPGADLPAVRDLMISAIAHRAGQAARTRADLWTALLLLAETGRANAGGDPADGYLATALAYIDRNLAAHLTVPDVAAATGISHTHLTRLFTERTGRTVVAHIRERRADRAGHLLRESTLSVAAVAASVGMADLQALNKLCRSATGLSPRQLRARR